MPTLTPGCRSYHECARLSRRGFLRLGGLGLAGLTLPKLLQAQASGVRRETAAIVLFLAGGPSQLDTWDPKPDAPAGIRGEFGVIPTTVPGIRLCEHLPYSARFMDRWSIVRSLTFREGAVARDHGFCSQVCWSGFPATDGRPVHPSFDCVAVRQLEGLNRAVPAAVDVPRLGNGPGSFFEWGHGPAYLGSAVMPVGTSNPDGHGNFSAGELDLPFDLSAQRLRDRDALRRGFDELRRTADQSPGLDPFQRQAVDLITSGVTRRAFDLAQEPPAVRDRYGFMGSWRARNGYNSGYANGWGQHMLLARRLVEAGVRLVTVTMDNWDTHDDNFWMMKNGLLPRFDQPFSALIEDLDQRGLLDTTLVIAFGEMGRAPFITETGGRNHWLTVMSGVFAGGGVRGGRVVGSTDPKAGEVKENPKLVQDIHATLYRHLGIPLDTIYHDPTGRPHPLLPAGKPIEELF